MIDKPHRVTLIRATVCVGMALWAVSCSGSDGADEESVPTDPPTATQADTTTTTTTTSTTTSTTTTVPAATTTDFEPVVETVPDTEVEAPATSEDSVPEDSLPAPTNTMFDPETVEGEIEQAALLNFAAFVRCLEQLPACDQDQLTQFAALNYADGNRELATGWNAAGYEARDTDNYNYRVDEIEEIAETGVQAVVVMCKWGSTHFVQPATESAPEELLDDDEPWSTIDKYLLDKIGEAWFVTASESVQDSTGVEANLCE